MLTSEMKWKWIPETACVDSVISLITYPWIVAVLKLDLRWANHSNQSEIRAKISCFSYELNLLEICLIFDTVLIVKISKVETNQRLSQNKNSLKKIRFFFEIFPNFIIICFKFSLKFQKLYKSFQNFVKFYFSLNYFKLILSQTSFIFLKILKFF